VAEGIQNRAAAQFAGLSTTGTRGDQPATTRLGTGGRYAVKSVNELGTKNQAGHSELARDHIQTGSEFIVMRRDHKWKIVVYLDDTYGELYDLSKDPGEVRNLWDDPAHREMRAELAKSCLAWVAKGMLQASRRPSRKPQQPMKI